MHRQLVVSCAETMLEHIFVSLLQVKYRRRREVGSKLAATASVFCAATADRCRRSVDGSIRSMFVCSTHFQSVAVASASSSS
jgi:hypothetical protein